MSRFRIARRIAKALGGRRGARRKAVAAAHARRDKRRSAVQVDVEWKGDQVVDTVSTAVGSNVRLATAFLQTKVVQNISRPVTKTVVSRGTTTATVASNRSRPGEFPKADTTQLLKTIFFVVDQGSPGVWNGYVGTPLDYGLILETSPRLKRSFLQRTLREEQSTVKRFLTRRVPGG